MSELAPESYTRRPQKPLFSLRQLRKNPADVDAYLFAIQGDLELMRREIARLPTRNEIWRAVLLGILGGAVLLQILALLLH
jgi:hypothetical protein